MWWKKQGVRMTDMLVVGGGIILLGLALAAILQMHPKNQVPDDPYWDYLDED